VFGNGTLAIVKQFQKDNKLKIDGSMDADDIKVLNDKFDAKMGSADAQLDKALEEIKKMITQ
jgi:peptidoglycan hydrolase-like protein with peptidoglycan-binding domain